MCVVYTTLLGRIVIAKLPENPFYGSGPGLTHRCLPCRIRIFRETIGLLRRADEAEAEVVAAPVVGVAVVPVRDGTAERDVVPTAAT